MKIKFLAIFLTGLLLGALLGNILFGQVIAQTGDYDHYLKKIYSILTDIQSDVSSIQSDVSWLYWKLD